MKNLIRKLLIFLHIIDLEKPLIKLTKTDKMWIKLMKNHYVDNEKYHVNASSWIDTLKPMFEEIYGYDPDKHIKDFRYCMSRRLFKLWYKIDPRMHQDNIDFKCDILMQVHAVSFRRSIVRDYEEPVDRFIAELCGQIQCIQVIRRDGQRIIDLDNVEDDK